MAIPRIMQTMPRTLVFYAKHLGEILATSLPTGSSNTGGADDC